MHLVHTDTVLRVPPGTTPDYASQNPLRALLGLVEREKFAADREVYLPDELQFLVPIAGLELYGPSAPDDATLDPTAQDVKTDFQKQNVRTFRTADTMLVRGVAATDGWRTPFLRLSYRGGPDSVLSLAAGHALGDEIRAWVRVGGIATTAPLRVPYDERTDRYVVELWGQPVPDVRSALYGLGREAFDAGKIVVRPDLVRGAVGAFGRQAVGDCRVRDIERDHLLHPVRPLAVELAWSNVAGTAWDSNEGRNHRYVFSMIVRGRDAFLAAGSSASPHGGVGSLEYRNLLSNYFGHGDVPELGRTLAPWSIDAHGVKGRGGTEDFLAVDYMDLHLLRGNSGIGLHRHRDNQEIFLVMSGRGYMVVGDWCAMDDRERALEIRTLRAGHFAMLKGGQLHGLMNATDEDMDLFMFGGYD